MGGGRRVYVGTKCFKGGLLGELSSDFQPDLIGLKIDRNDSRSSEVKGQLGGRFQKCANWVQMTGMILIAF